MADLRISVRNLTAKERSAAARGREKEAADQAALADRLEVIERTTRAIAAIVGIDTESLKEA